MNISGISIDQVGTKYREDGFSIEKHQDYYMLSFAVVNLGSKLKNYTGKLTGQERVYLLPENDVKKSAISFNEVPRQAFIFNVEIGLDGRVRRFSPRFGTFSILRSYCFSSENVDCDHVFLLKECMDVIAGGAEFPFITKSNSLAQLVQNLSLFISLNLFDYMVRKIGVSVLYSGVTSGDIVGMKSASYRNNVGRLFVLDDNYGVRIVNGEGLLVSTKKTRGVVYSDDDISSTGNYVMPISSPFRNDDAIVNQIILAAYLSDDCLEAPQSSKMSIYGPTKECRDQYMQRTSRVNEFQTITNSKAKLHPSLIITGKLLKNYISILVDNNLMSPQLDGLGVSAQTSLNDQIYICSYFLAVGKQLPDKLNSFLTSISVDNSSSAGSFLHLLQGMPFVTTSTSGGVVSLGINGRLYEVDNCAGHKVRLLNKIRKGLSRDQTQIPSTFVARINLLERLLSDSEVSYYLKKRGL